MKRLLVDIPYFPSIDFFSYLLTAEEIHIEIHQNLNSIAYPLNRCYIAMSQKIQALSIPIRKPYKRGNPQNCLLDYSDRWHIKHWRSFEAAYNQSPYFEYYAEELRHCLFSQIPTLCELNLLLLSIIMKYLHIPKRIIKTNNYQQEYPKTITDMRSQINTAPYPSEKFQYRQVFNIPFFANLSILDLLFNYGNHSIDFL